jgi:DNA invertase Pin-like site-specific DNA recombinase
MRTDVEVIRGVDKQTADNAACASLLQLGPVRHFTDNNRSASQFATKAREEWDALLDHVRSGAASHVLVWLLDRAARTTEGTEALLAACRQGGALIVQTAGSPVIADPNNPDDIFRLKMAALLAEYEVAKMSIRQKRHKLATAEAGKPHGGRRLFGYETDRTIRESEAAVVRDLAARFLAGSSLRSLAAWLNEEGVPTPSTEARLAAGEKPAQWTGPNLRGMLRRPAYAALRVHKGAVVGDAAWEPIISRAEHERIMAITDDPARRINKTGNARRHLLTSLATCATCGEHLKSHSATGKNLAAAYRCATGQHCYRTITLVDRVVVDRVVDRLRSMDASGLLPLDDGDTELEDATRDRDALDARLVEYGALAHTMPPAAYAAAVTGITAERDALAARVKTLAAGRAAPSTVLENMTGEAAPAAWEAADLGRRRAVLALLAESIQLRGATLTGDRKFHASDVVIVWR